MAEHIAWGLYSEGSGWDSEAALPDCSLLRHNLTILTAVHAEDFTERRSPGFCLRTEGCHILILLKLTGPSDMKEAQRGNATS